MKITFLSDNKTEKAACIAEWGLSILIESKGHKVLLDVGSSGIFARNAKALGIDLSDVEAVAISHGHFDHCGALKAIKEYSGARVWAPLGDLAAIDGRDIEVEKGTYPPFMEVEYVPFLVLTHHPIAFTANQSDKVFQSAVQMPAVYA